MPPSKLPDFMRRVALTCALCTLCMAAVGQLTQGQVVDGESGEPLIYCHVRYIGQPGGTITNEDGEFEVDGSVVDSIEVSYIGYRSQRLSVHSLEDSSVVRLMPMSIELGEISILSEDDGLYRIVAKCARTMQRQPAMTSKAYFHLETLTRDVPLEMMQCYYNGTVEGCAVKDLQLKNGRAGLPKLEGGGYYVSLSTTRAIIGSDLTEPGIEFPVNPLQLKRKECMLAFDLVRLPSFSDENTFHIAFTPKVANGGFYEGEMWIDRETYTLLKIILDCENATAYPFAMINENTTIGDIDFHIVQTYEKIGDDVYLDQIDFTYDLLMELKGEKQIDRLKLQTKGLLYMYEKDSDFVLPYFNYEPWYNDYERISCIPYDPIFWDETWGFKFSSLQLQRMGFFQREGVLLNFRQQYEDQLALRSNSVIWDPENRVSARYRGTKYNSAVPPIAAQVFLDINTSADTLRYASSTVLDLLRMYGYQEDPAVNNCFANIYFDLAEVSRRKLMRAIESASGDASAADRLYNDARKDLEDTLRKFERETRFGKNTKKLALWNALIKDELAIDNMELYGIDQE